MDLEYLEIWTRRKLGLSLNQPLTREALEGYQLEKIKATLKMARESSSFYQKRLEGVDLERMAALTDVQKIPFTTPEDLLERGKEMLCVNQNQISRIVTLETSGTSGLPKRVYFTREDQELTTDYFHTGLHNMADERDRPLILMPCRRPGSVGDLFRIAAERMGMKTVPYGLPGMEQQAVGNKGVTAPGSGNWDGLLQLMAEKKVTFILGLSTHVARLAGRYEEMLEASSGPAKEELLETGDRIRAVLLSAEYVSQGDREQIQRSWGCKIFEHYGMTEMGLGGAVSCHLRQGYHVREEDLYLEIVTPNTGKAVPDGELGEIVFTTLTRRGMPFIRYRTGDRSRFLPEPCACGSILKRLERVGPR